MDTTDGFGSYADPSRDLYGHSIRATDKRVEVERQLSTRWSREELEDKYLRLYAENNELREYKTKAQEKIKLLTTKLERLFQDKKKLLAGGAMSYNVQELQDQVMALRAQNEKLKAKVDIMSNQLKNQPKPSGLQGVSSKINSGLPKSEQTLQQTGNSTGMRSISPLVPKATRQMIDELRGENNQLRAEMIRLQRSLEDAQGRIEDGKRKLAEASAQYQDDLSRIKEAMGSDQRGNIRANIEQINMQRDLKDKSAKLQITTEKLRQLESQLEQYKINEQQLRREVDKLQTEVRLEQERRSHIHQELQSTSAAARTAPELETRLSDIARENIILKETNEKLTASAFDVDRERGVQDRETAYRIQIQQLEATLKADVGEKTSIIEKLTEERALADKIRQELKDERVMNGKLKQELESMQDKMKIFSKASAVDFDELGEALMLIRERKRASNVAANESTILKSVGAQSAADGIKDWRKLYEELEIVQAETVTELDRTRAILSVQYRINKDYAQEVEATTRRLESIQAESESRLQEYAKLLDLRLARIRKLEARLRDLAYGVRPLRPMAMVTPVGFEDAEQKGELEAGQNLFEVHLDTLRLSSDTLRILGEAEMVVFCTWGFFEFELQKSPVIRSYNSTALFDCTSQYIVTVDDFFLSYIAHRPLIIELHRSRGGLDYETLAAARISLKDLLDSTEPTCRMAGTVPFTGISGALEAIQVAELDFWVLLRVPMQHAFRLFRERLKAMNYLISDARSRDAAQSVMDIGNLAKAVATQDNVNILHVHVIRCQNLVAFGSAQAQPGQPKRQPSSYVAYKFLDYPEHVTATVPDSSAPQFNDHHTFTLYTTADTDRFLKTEALQLFVFDDVAADTEQTAYLGRARIPLISLTNNQPVAGLFELTRADGTASGVIEVRVSWQFAYKPPSNLSMLPAPKLGPDAEIPEVPVRDIDAQKLQQQLQQAARPQTSQLLGKTVQTAQLQADLPQPPQQPHQPMALTAPAQPVATLPPQIQGMSATATSNAQILPDTASLAPTPVHASPITLTASPTPAAVALSPAPSALSPPVASTLPSASPAPLSVISEPPQPVAAAAKSQSESGSQPEVVFESDSEGVVVETSRLPKSVRQSLEQVVSITVHSLRIKPDSVIGKDDNYNQLFVAFDFGAIPQDELETPLSLPKPTGGAERDLVYNFTKIIPVAPSKNAQNRAYLAQLLSASDRRARSLVFSIVNESTDSDECDDIAEALVDIQDLANKDVREGDFEVRALSDNSVVGNLKLTIICQDILKSIKQEMANATKDPSNFGVRSTSPTV